SGGTRRPHAGSVNQRTPGRSPPHRIIRPGNGPGSPRARSERSGYPVRSRREKIPFRGDGETQAVGGPTDDPPIAAGPTERDDGVAGRGAGETRRGDRGPRTHPSGNSHPTRTRTFKAGGPGEGSCRQGGRGRSVLA